MNNSSNSPMNFISETSLNFNYLFKFILIGDTDTGKSNILLGLSYGQFKHEYQLT